MNARCKGLFTVAAFAGHRRDNGFLPNQPRIAALPQPPSQSAYSLSGNRARLFTRALLSSAAGNSSESFQSRQRLAAGASA